MIAVDKSALMAIALDEPDSCRCIDILEVADEVLILAGTVAETLSVARRRNVGVEVATLIEGLGFKIIPVTPLGARQVAQAYDQWGKGSHRAGLNFGDCFAYALARERDCPLLYVGQDFSKTDLATAL